VLLTLVFKSTAVDGGYPCCLGNERLTASENVRDLGVVVDSQLCFSEHIANIVGIQVYNFICPLNFLKFAYKGLVWNPLHGFRLSI